MAYFNKYVLLFLIKIVHKKLFKNFQDEKELFLNYKKFDLFTSEKCIFPKGLTHNFGQKVKFFLTLIFQQNCLIKNCLKIFEIKKNYFLPIKNLIFLAPKRAFFQRGQPTIFAKNSKFFQPLFFIKIVHKILFEYFLDRKEPFINYKKFNLFKSKKCTFPKGLTHDFGQNFKLFSALISHQNSS